MKQNFNNVGFAQVQSQLLALPPAELATQLQALRTDLITWMLAHFNLTLSEQEQLESLPQTFRQDMASGIADVFEQGGTISFFKSEYAEAKGREDRDGKDILYRPAKQQQYSFDEEELKETLELTIWIT